MKIKIISDIDHFYIMEAFRKKDYESLKNLQEIIINGCSESKGLGREKC